MTKEHRTVRATVLGMVAVLAMPSLGFAQEAPTNEELLRRINALEAQLAELKDVLQARHPSTTRTEQSPPAPGGSASTPIQDEKPLADHAQEFKFGAMLDTYYDYNFNRPVGRVNLGRAYDITSNSFSLNQASLVLESPADLAVGRRFGARVDLQYGQATETLQGSLVNEPRPWVYRNVFQAYGTYVAPIGSGMTVDFGKWASALGYENNYTKDQINYSRSYWFDFLPFYHMGARLTYRFNDALTASYWITNGTQQSEAFNNFKDQYAGLVLQPNKTLSWTIGYYLGQEHPDVQFLPGPGRPTLPTQAGLSITPVVPYFTGKLQIFDSYATFQPSPAISVTLEGDYVSSQNPSAPASRAYGGAVYVKHQLTPKSALAARAEYLADRGGLFTGTTQNLKEGTVTYDYRLNDGFLVRSEWRHDFSDTAFFLTNTPNVLKTSQDTATLGLVWWWGTKRGAW